jgi:hypothetical protein
MADMGCTDGMRYLPNTCQRAPKPTRRTSPSRVEWFSPFPRRFPDLVSIAVLVAFAEDNRRVVGRHLVRLKQIEPGPLGEVGDLIDPVRRLRAAKAGLAVLSPQAFDPYRQPVAGFRDRPHLPGRHAV